MKMRLSLNNSLKMMGLILKKNYSLNQILSKLILLFCTSSIMISCSNKVDKINQEFLNRYGNNVKKINIKRDLEKMQNESVEGYWNCQKNNSCLNKNENQKNSEQFLPDLQTLLQGKAGQMPEDMFQISYNLQNFPSNYAKNKLSFDDIKIPKNNNFEIEAQLEEKNYQLINNGTLQKNIDLTKKFEAKEDKQLIMELINQEKEIKKTYFPSQ